MKRTPINIFFMLIALFFSVTTAKAQSAEDEQKANEMIKQAQEMMKKIPVYADSIGIYALTDKGWKHHEPIKSHQTTANVSALLVQSKLQFPGKKAELRFDSIAVFRIYFGVPAPEMAGKYAMFMPDKSINGFSIVKLTQHKNNRRLRTMKAKPFVGVVSGVEDTDDVTTEVKEIRKGLYEIHISGKPREYGITYTAEGMGGYIGIYDLGIDIRPGKYVSYWDR